MPLLEGQIVIHPHHGPATVLGFMTRVLRGREVEYAELRITSQELTVAVPLKSLKEVGLRDVASRSQLDKLTKVLAAPSPAEEKTWSRRVKAHGAKLITGLPLRIAEVARDLTRRQDRVAISMAEREILRDAMRPLVAEVAVAVNLSEERAEEVIVELIRTGSREVLDQMAMAA